MRPLPLHGALQYKTNGTLSYAFSRSDKWMTNALHATRSWSHLILESPLRAGVAQLSEVTRAL